MGREHTVGEVFFKYIGTSEKTKLNLYSPIPQELVLLEGKGSEIS